jgi:[ribosomal protein S5]-alanine N-acetyltransferase
MVTLETERLVLRPLVPDDAENLFGIISDPENVRFLGTISSSVEQVRGYIKKHVADNEANGLGFCAAILRSTGDVIGRAGLFLSKIDGKDEVELAYLFDKTHWGCGYATEAARAFVDYGDEIGAGRMIAIVHPLNIASIRVAEKTGFVYERMLADYKDFGNVGLYSREPADANRLQ